MLTSRIDELADESSEAARETGGLAGALGSVAAAAVPASVALSAMPDGDSFGSGLSANVAGISGSLGTLLPLLALAGTLIPGLISGFGGLAAAAVGLSGALAGIFAGGLLAKGQELADQSAEIEDKFAGAQQILKNFKDELSQALEPLQNIPGAGAFSFSVLDAAVGTVRKLSEAGADLAGVLIPMADRLMAVGDAAGSAALDELVTTVREFAPYIEAAIGAGLRLLPDLLAAIRDDARNLLPAFASFASAVIIAAPVIADMGVAIGQVLLPVLAGMARALAPLEPLTSMLADAIAAIPVWIFEAVGAALLGIAGAIGALALPALASALGSAAVAAGAFVLATLPISGTILAIALAIGAVIGVLGYLVTHMDAVGKAWKKVVDFMADKIQGLVGFFTDQVNKLLAVAESMRQKLNAVLPDRMEIEGRINQIETPQVGDDVQSLGEGIGGAVDDMMPDSGGSGSGESTEGQQAGGPVVHGDYFEGPVDQSNNAEVENNGEDKRIARLVEDALDRSERHSQRRGSASQ
jgi:phage-related protein